MIVGGPASATPISAQFAGRCSSTGPLLTTPGFKTKGKTVAIAATEKEQNTSKVQGGKRERRRAMDRRESPIHTRKAASEDYEEPVSGREGWWRIYIRETPNPGSYEPRHFLEDLVKKQNTYRFKSDGRRLDPQPQIGRGAYLLPGAYEHEDLTDRLDKNQMTYGFKGSDRDQRDFLNFGKKDKDINVCPTNYEIEKYGSMSVQKHSSRHWQFKSQSQRFPTTYFRPKDGPGPGNYEYVAPPPAKPVQSAFLSKTPRFSSSHTKVPGPGAYDKTVQEPMPKTIMKMGRSHGLFFSSAFQA